MTRTEVLHLHGEAGRPEASVAHRDAKTASTAGYFRHTFYRKTTLGLGD